MVNESQWTARRKVQLLLELIKGETTLADAAREHDLQQSEIKLWMDVFLAGGERSLKDLVVDEHDRALRQLAANVGALVSEFIARGTLRGRSESISPRRT